MAAATAKFGNGMILSSVSHPGLEKTAEAARDGFRVFQLYVRGDENWVDDHVRRAMDHGYAAFCLTVDTDSYSRRERDIAKRHERRRVRVGDARIYQARFNWRDIERIKRLSKIPVLDQGHRHRRGRQDRGRSRGRLRLRVEPRRPPARPGHRLGRGVAGGRRGGRRARQGLGRRLDHPRHRRRQGDHPRRRRVVVGRLYVYGLAAAGGPGVVRLFEILEDEIRICLSLLGVNRYDELDKSYIRAGPAGRAGARPQPLPAPRPAGGDVSVAGGDKPLSLWERVPEGAARRRVRVRPPPEDPPLPHCGRGVRPQSLMPSSLAAVAPRILILSASVMSGIDRMWSTGAVFHGNG